MQEEQKSNLVDCNRCGHWSDERRFKEVCEQCNNTRKTVDPSTILCNRCGECMRPLRTMNEQYPHGLEGAKITGGYDSYHLFDMTTYTFSICEKCLRELFNQFKVPPKVEDTMDLQPIEYAWKRDQEAYEYRVWKDEGGHHKAYMEKRCNSIKDCPNRAVYTLLHSGDFSEDSACEEHKEKRLYSNTRFTKFISPVLRAFL
jgi:hypothetical protein